MPGDTAANTFAPFLSADALWINKARQAHLAALGLDLRDKTVLEVGAGIGLHTAFFEERGCRVVSTDGNPSNVAEMARRHPERALGVLDLDRADSLADLGQFDIIYCYGTLYHLNDPDGALARLAEICTGQILVETIVSRGAFAELHRVVEPLTANQAVLGLGVRPTRPWVMAALARHFGHAYTTVGQPDFPDFAKDWEMVDHSGNLRAVFVGSKDALDLPALTSTLPEFHPAAGRTANKPRPHRVWIDVGAYQGDYSLKAALDDPDLQVHAFEPAPALAAALPRSENFLVHPMAVLDRDGYAPFFVNRFAAASSLLPIDETARQSWIDGDLLIEERSFLVPTTRLDTFLDRYGISNVEWLKIDAQGADFQVVQSAGERLRDIERITLEATVTERQLYAGAAEKATIVDFLQARGFDLAEVEPQSHGQEENLTFVNRLKNGVA